MSQLQMDWSLLTELKQAALVKLSGAIDPETVLTFEAKMKEM